MGFAVGLPDSVRFGIFEVDLSAGEIRKNGIKVKLSGQPFQVLTILLSRPEEVVTREELQKQLWPDTFVDAERNLNTAINKIREVLGDSADSPRFIETLPRRGYRFIAPIQPTQKEIHPSAPAQAQPPVLERLPKKRFSIWVSVGVALTVLASVSSYLVYRPDSSQKARKDRVLSRVSFAKGLQLGAT